MGCIERLSLELRNYMLFQSQNTKFVGTVRVKKFTWRATLRCWNKFYKKCFWFHSLKSLVGLLHYNMQNSCQEFSMPKYSKTCFLTYWCMNLHKYADQFFSKFQIIFLWCLYIFELLNDTGPSFYLGRHVISVLKIYWLRI